MPYDCICPHCDRAFTVTNSTRFWALVDKHGPCWLWTGPRFNSGYGRFSWYDAPRKVRQGAHLFAYRDAGGVIPEGWEVDHLCQQKLCVRPSHLEAVPKAINRARVEERRVPATHCKRGHRYEQPYAPGVRRICRRCNLNGQNVRNRGPIPPPRSRYATACVNGHEYTPENTYRKNGGQRRCRICTLEQNRAAQARRRGGPPRATYGTECRQGHPYTPENTYIEPSTGYRRCRICMRATQQASDARRLAISR